MGLERCRVALSAAVGAVLVMAGVAAVAAPARPPVKIAFVYATPVGTAGAAYQHHMGRLALEKNLGDAVKTTAVENVAEAAEAERVLRALAEKGHHLIFATSAAHQSAVRRVAAEFPGVAFESMGDDAAPARPDPAVRNVSPYSVRVHQGRYLAGLVAGKSSRSGVVGHVAGLPTPEALLSLDAFTRGMRAANPKARVEVAWLDTPFSPAKERVAAERLLRSGADLLTQYQGSSAVAEVAERHAAQGVRLLGDQSDLRSHAPATQLTSSTLHWGDRYTAVARTVMAGTWQPKPFRGGVRERVIRMAPYSPEVPREVQRQVSEVERAMAAGR